MTNIWEKAISILAGNLNLGRIYLITTVTSSCMFLRKNTLEQLEYKLEIIFEFRNLQENPHWYTYEIGRSDAGASC